MNVDDLERGCLLKARLLQDVQDEGVAGWDSDHLHGGAGEVGQDRPISHEERGVRIREEERGQRLRVALEREITVDSDKIDQLTTILNGQDSVGTCSTEPFVTLEGDEPVADDETHRGREHRSGDLDARIVY